MKITDYSILFLIILIVFCYLYEFKDNIAFENKLNGEKINKIIDNTVVYALEKGCNLDNRETDLEEISEIFFDTASEIIYGNCSTDSKMKINSKVLAFILVKKNEYYIYSDGKWGEKNIFNSDLHNGQVCEIEKVIQEKMDNKLYSILFPKNSGEIFAQTISEYSLLVVFETERYTYDGVQYSNCMLSGAAIK